MNKKMKISKMGAALIKALAMAVLFCVIAYLIWTTLDNWFLACITTAGLIASLMFAGYMDAIVRPQNVNVEMHVEKKEDEKPEMNMLKAYDFMFDYGKTDAIKACIDCEAQLTFEDYENLTDEQKVMRSEHEEILERTQSLLADRESGKFDEMDAVQRRLLYAQLAFMFHYTLVLGARCVAMNIAHNPAVADEEEENHVTDHQDQES